MTVETVESRTSEPRRVLMAFASRHGSTEEVAHAIASALRDRGFAVDLRSATAVHGVSGYDAVIVGGALYTARWHREARRLLHRERAALAQMPIAVFAMGPRTLDDDEVEHSRRELEVALAEVPEVRPVSVAIFSVARSVPADRLR